MNHRDLMLSAQKRAKFKFLSLPSSLQDEVIRGLDSHRLTIHAASTLIASKGYSVCPDAVSGYYEAVRRERRQLLINRSLQQAREA